MLAAMVYVEPTGRAPAGGAAEPRAGLQSPEL
jgi:hypothetical protein